MAGCMIYSICKVGCKKIKINKTHYGSGYGTDIEINLLKTKISIHGINCLNCDTFKNKIQEQLNKSRGVKR